MFRKRKKPIRLAPEAMEQYRGLAAERDKAAHAIVAFIKGCASQADVPNGWRFDPKEGAFFPPE